MCHLIYHNIFVCCSAVQPSGRMLCGLCVAINMMSLVCDANPQKTSTVCTLHSAFVHLSLILFIYYLLIYFFSKHGVLQDYKAPFELISKDSYAMIPVMLCEFIVKDVIPPCSKFHYGPLWNCENLRLWHVVIWTWCTCTCVYLY